MLSLVSDGNHGSMRRRGRQRLVSHVKILQYKCKSCIQNLSKIEEQKYQKVYKTSLDALQVRAVIGWLRTESFVLSANLHGGALVASYPYDNSNGGKHIQTKTVTSQMNKIVCVKQQHCLFLFGNLNFILHCMLFYSYSQPFLITLCTKCVAQIKLQSLFSHLNIIFTSTICKI